MAILKNKPPKKILPPGKKPRARPEVKIDWVKVDNLLKSGCTGTQIAAYLGISPDCLYQRTFDQTGIYFTEYAQLKRSVGDSLLTSKQFELAMKGDRNMLIWLGKQRLGQMDKSYAEIDNQSVILTKQILELPDNGRRQPVTNDN